jgi:hypothetical protein
MKTIKYIYLFLILMPLFIIGCSENLMDEINKERNDALNVEARNMLPSIELKTAVQTVGTEYGWYATVYIEHSAGTWSQSYLADRRSNCNNSTLFNNNWNSSYEIIMICKDIINKCSPNGIEPKNYHTLAVAQTIMAFNLAYLTDFWGEVPFEEACLGLANRAPKYEKQSVLYPKIQKLLDDAINNFSKESLIPINNFDYIYEGNIGKWIKAAYSLKARYWLRLSKVDNTAAAKALEYAAKGFANAADQMMFAAYEPTSTGENPWFQFANDRKHLSVGKTLYDIMNSRKDPRMEKYFKLLGGKIVPAPNGSAEQDHSIYSVSLLTATGQTAPSPFMTYHELKFIEAEAKYILNPTAYKDALKTAIQASFNFHGASGFDAYFTDIVDDRLALTPYRELMTQKYIAMYEFEAVEAYNDYRRTGYPDMNNPANKNPNYGFVLRFPWADSEVVSNPTNVPQGVNIFKDKIWWAGGKEF